MTTAIALLIAGILAALAITYWWWRRAHVAPADTPTGPFPVVLVHGFFGFDRIELFGRRAHYFRGVADELERLGADVHVVKLPAIASVPDRAAVLAARVRAIDAPRVNLIAHSMGGVDARYAISQLGLAERVAALVTIGTPHHGTPLARVGNLAPVAALRAGLDRLGVDANGSAWLTPERMASFNRQVADAPGVHYASVVGRPRGLGVGSVGRRLLMRRAGTSDGVVPSESQAWGEVILEVDADHWAQIGWSRRPVAAPIYRAIARHLRDRGL